MTWETGSSCQVDAGPVILQMTSVTVHGPFRNWRCDVKNLGNRVTSNLTLNKVSIPPFENMGATRGVESVLWNWSFLVCMFDLPYKVVVMGEGLKRLQIVQENQRAMKTF